MKKTYNQNHNKLSTNNSHKHSNSDKQIIKDTDDTIKHITIEEYKEAVEGINLTDFAPPSQDLSVEAEPVKVVG